MRIGKFFLCTGNYYRQALSILCNARVRWLSKTVASSLEKNLGHSWDKDTVHLSQLEEFVLSPKTDCEAGQDPHNRDRPAADIFRSKTTGRRLR